MAMLVNPDNAVVPEFPRCAASVLGAVFAVMAGAVPALADPSIGQFEMKTLESGPGYLEFQSQNAWSFGQPDREVVISGGEVVTDGNAIIKQRNALEIEMGFTSYLKMRVGIEYEKERVDDPETLDAIGGYEPLKLDEIGVEVIGVIIPRSGDGFSLGAVVEVERPLEREEQMSVLMGPILEYRAGPWFFAAIPMMVHSFGGEPDDDGISDDKWDFAYAAQTSYTFSETWMLSLEAYGTVERVGNTGERGESALLFGDHDQHRIGPVLYYTQSFGRSLRPDPIRDEDGGIEDSELTVGLGFLAGLNGNTPDGTLKLSVEVEF